MANKVLRVCNSIRAISDDELAELDAMARGQVEFLSPLRMATTARQNALGAHNLAVLQQLRALRDTINRGASLTDAARAILQSTGEGEGK